MRSIWRQQPTNRLLSSAFIPKDVTSASVYVADDFFEVAIVETIVAKGFPMLYLAEPLDANELVSRVSGSTVTKIGNDFPHEALKAQGGVRAKQLTSWWT